MLWVIRRLRVRPTLCSGVVSSRPAAIDVALIHIGRSIGKLAERSAVKAIETTCAG